MITVKHHVDKRGLFYELWKGQPKLRIKQVNISHSKKGVVRGIHFEPWDKYIHVIKGKIFAAIMYKGKIKKYVLDNTKALYIPKGSGNSFQALEDTIYCYLTTGRWQKGKKYKSLSYKLIKWPLKPIVSKKDD